MEIILYVIMMLCTIVLVTLFILGTLFENYGPTLGLGFPFILIGIITLFLKVKLSKFNLGNIITDFNEIIKSRDISDKVFLSIIPLIIILGLSDISLSNIDLEGSSHNKDSLVSEKNEVIIENKEENKDSDNNNQPYIFFNKSIQGRGRSDEGRSEPKYTGLYGYAVVYDGYDFRKLSIDAPWTIPTYKKIDYDHYEIDGELEHKTVIKVISQNLTHQGYGSYDGFLTVTISGDESTQYLIDVSNFVTNDYWNFGSVYSSTNYGYTVAQYNQKSDKLPVYVDNDIAEVKEGTKVIIKGKTGRYPGKKVDNTLRQIEGYYVNRDGLERTVFFNENDLKIIY